MVSPYCSLLFSRKEIIKFSVEALVSALYNCLIGCIVITRGYRPWNTANTTADICLLTENSNKNTETKCKVCSKFFYQPFGCPKGNYGPLTRRQPHSPAVNYKTISSMTRRSPETTQWGWFPKPERAHQWDLMQRTSDSEYNVLSHASFSRKVY